MTTLIEDEIQVKNTAEHLSIAITKQELINILIKEISIYTLADLQVIGGRLHTEIVRLPRSYRDKVGPFLTDQVLGGYHRLMTIYRSGRLNEIKGSISELETFRKYCEIIPDGCSQWNDASLRMPVPYTVKHRLFYYLIGAFTMFILEQPGHPVGTPFPGGFKVEERNGTYYCLIRDKEKEVPYSLCNFCPAVQSDIEKPGDKSRQRAY
jgi:uncharacterized protein (UPF0305 family)